MSILAPRVPAACAGVRPRAQNSTRRPPRSTGAVRDSRRARAHFPGATLLRISVHDLAGHMALRKGEHEKAIAELEQAVKLEDGLPYMEPPFCYMPMRHGLGAALLTAGKAAEAEQGYHEDLRPNPATAGRCSGSRRACARRAGRKWPTRCFNLA
jgi:hypothetical protein